MPALHLIESQKDRDNLEAPTCNLLVRGQKRGNEAITSAMLIETDAPELDQVDLGAYAVLDDEKEIKMQDTSETKRVRY